MVPETTTETAKRGDQLNNPGLAETPMNNNNNVNDLSARNLMSDYSTRQKP